jgi:hypothetical protein
MRLAAVFMVSVVQLLGAAGRVAATDESAGRWIDRVLSVPYASPSPPDQPTLQLLYQDFERLGLGKNCMGGPMKIGTRTFEHGLGTHANSRIRILKPPCGASASTCRTTASSRI